MTAVESAPTRNSVACPIPNMRAESMLRPDKTRLRAFYPATAVAIIVIGLLMWLGTPILDVLKLSFYLLYGIQLPGTLLYRAFRKTPHSLIDDLVIGFAVGLAVEILAYILFGTMGILPWLWVWPALLLSSFIAVPRLRLHCQRVTYRHRSPLLWSWTVAAVVVAYLGYLVIVQLYKQGPMPDPGGTKYLFDLLFLFSLSGEAKYHFPLETPQLAGEALHYHWFGFAHTATASLVSGVDLPTMFFRFDPVIVGVGGVLTLAVAGWRISGKPWVGALATVLTFGVGELSIHSLAPFFGSSTAFSWTSPSATYAWIPTFALLIMVVELVRKHGLPDQPLGQGAWILLALFAFVTAGAKASGILTVVAGVGLVITISLIRRRIVRQLWLVGLVLAGVMLAITALVYKFDSNGLIFKPMMLYTKMVSHIQIAQEPVVLAYGIAFFAFMCFLLPRLAGIGVLAYGAMRRRVVWGNTEWFLLGTIGCGIAGIVLFHHPNASQVYFLRSAWGAGAILSSMGYVYLVERHNIKPRLAFGIPIAVGGVMFGLITLLSLDRAPWTNNPYGIWRPIAIAAAATVAIGIATIIVTGWLRFHRRIQKGVIAAALLSVSLMSGSATFFIEMKEYGPSWTAYHENVTPNMVSGAQWVRDHSDPTDVIATNQHNSLSFWLNAYSERRTLVGSWTYSQKSLNQAQVMGTSSQHVPFHDPALLALNDSVFTNPTPELLARLYTDYGVRWLVVNRDISMESPMLRTLAKLRFEKQPLAVYELQG